MGGAPETDTETPPIIFLFLFSGSFFAYFFLEKSRSFLPSFFTKKRKKGDFAVCGRRPRLCLRLPYTAGVFRSLRRAAKGVALRTYKLFEKSLIKNFKKLSIKL